MTSLGTRLLRPRAGRIAGRPEPLLEPGGGRGTDAADPRVDAYIERLSAWQQAICQQVRELVHAADPDVVETIKRRVQPHFVLDGNICALLAAKDHVNVFLYDGAIVPDPEGIITAGMRTRRLAPSPSARASRSMLGR